MSNNEILSSSFRDPSGFLFKQNGILYRQVNKSYQNHYDALFSSGLYETLTKQNLLISHSECDPDPEASQAYKTIQPRMIPFISYPYEWSFSQLKETALCTLRIQKCAFDHGMSLKDASAFNIQFKDGKPILIDTLSFEKYEEGSPWVAYRQFCQHFLAPLALMAYQDIRLSQLFKIYIDGIPLDLASKLLPGKTKFKFSLLTHIHMHAKSQQHYSDKAIKVSKQSFSKMSFLGLMDNLESVIKSLEWTPKGTEWGKYYENTNYVDEAMQHKKDLVKKYIDIANPASVWDLGANTGIFSRIASAKGIQTIAFDIDPAAVEKNYREVLSSSENNILPLVIDLTSPSPAIGWNNQERMTINERGPVDLILALALIHHIAISNNVPLNRIAEYLKELCAHLIIEFVPKSDSQVKILLTTREDIFDEYTQKDFERIFSQYFDIKQSTPVKSSDRVLYLMAKKNG